MKVFLDGRWLDGGQVKTPVYEPGFLCAQGLFETMRAYNNKVFRLDAHITRLLRSSGIIKINLNYSKEGLKDIINKALSLNNYFSAYVRLTVWQGEGRAHISVIAKEYKPYPREKYFSGFRVILSDIRQNEASILANIKSSSRLHFLLAEYEARERNADEAILLNTRGRIAEGTRTNIFLLKKTCILFIRIIIISSLSFTKTLISMVVYLWKRC